jgi:hypothetical protein
MEVWSKLPPRREEQSLLRKDHSPYDLHVLARLLPLRDGDNNFSGKPFQKQDGVDNQPGLFNNCVYLSSPALILRVFKAKVCISTPKGGSGWANLLTLPLPTERPWVIQQIPFLCPSPLLLSLFGRLGRVARPNV